MASELRITDTNNTEDSAGLVWGIEGNLFWWIVGGAFVSVVSLLLLFSVFKVSFVTSLLIAVAPLLLVLVYVLLFKQNKPPCFDVDSLDRLFSVCGFRSRGFAPDVTKQPPHPLENK